MINASDDRLDYEGEVAIVTGAGRGIGAAYARELASRGCAVVVNDLGVGPFGEANSDDPAAVIVDEINAAGGSAVADRSDIATSPEGPVDAAFRAFGRVDIVINNAGSLSRVPFPEMSRTHLTAALRVHLLGAVSLTQAAWPELSSRHGRVLFTSSSAVWGVPGSLPYSVAKSSMIGLVNTLALEAAEHGVRVNGVLPGASTRMVVGSPGNRGPSVKDMVDEHLDPRFVSAFVTWLMHSATDITGELFTVGGGRAARLVVAEALGHVSRSTEAESWCGSEGELLAMDQLFAAASTLDSIGLNADLLGGSASNAFRTVVPGGPQLKRGR